MRLAFCTGPFIVRVCSRHGGTFIFTQILGTIENTHAFPLMRFACKTHLACLEPQCGTQHRPRGPIAWVRLVTGGSSSGACKYSITDQPRLQTKETLLPKHSSLQSRSRVRTEKRGPMRGASGGRHWQSTCIRPRAQCGGQGRMKTASHGARGSPWARERNRMISHRGRATGERILVGNEV